MHKGIRDKNGNGGHHERRSWCPRERFGFSRSLPWSRLSRKFRLFCHFGRSSPQEKPPRRLMTIFYARWNRFYSFADLWTHCAWVAGCDGVAPGILCGGREKGTRSLWMLRVRCLPCAIILANALTERVWSAAPGLREKRSWAASLFTLARARRSLPSSDLNGRCLSRGAVSLATRGQKRACRAKHPAAKQGGTAEFNRPWVSEKRPRTVFYCRVRAGGAWAPCRQEGR